MTFPVYLIGTTEYVVATVTSDVELDTQPVTILVEGTEYDAQWIGTADTTRLCRTDDALDFSAVADGLYRLEVKIEDSPEIPLVDAGYIRVKAAAVAVP